MHTGAGACNSNIKKLQTDDLLLIETQFVVMGNFVIMDALCVTGVVTVQIA